MSYQSLDHAIPPQSGMDNEYPDARTSKKSVAGAIILCLLGFVLWTSSSRSSNAAVFNLKERSNICELSTFTKTTLKTAHESSMVALFRELHDIKKFEASDVIVVKDAYFVVYDNLYSIGRIAKDLPFRSSRNALIGNRTGESGYEALDYDEVSNRFFVIVEAVSNAQSKFHALVEEIEMIDATEEDTATLQTKAIVSYMETEKCPCEFAFSSENKGFEGAALVRLDDEHLFLLGLCEGNNCMGEAEGKDSGNGRVVVMTKIAATKSQGCYWKTVRVLNLPSSADFVDYSALSLHRTATNQFSVAVTSQESAAVWIGKLTVSHDTSAADWKFSGGSIYNFPRNEQCDVIYCNVEGVSFVSDSVLVAVSDRMKSGNKQPFRCLPKDQSIHLFVLP